MSDRGFLFLFSVLMIVASVAATIYLIATGQAGTVDGLFLALTALLVAVVFLLYVKFMIDRAMDEARAANKPPAKAAVKESPAKPAPVQS